MSSQNSEHKMGCICSFHIYSIYEWGFFLDLFILKQNEMKIIFKKYILKQNEIIHGRGSLTNTEINSHPNKLSLRSNFSSSPPKG